MEVELFKTSVKKFLVTIVDDDSVNIDTIHKAITEVTEGHLTIWEEAEKELRTSRKKTSSG